MFLQEEKNARLGAVLLAPGAGFHIFFKRGSDLDLGFRDLDGTNTIFITAELVTFKSPSTEGDETITYGEEADIAQIQISVSSSGNVTVQFGHQAPKSRQLRSPLNLPRVHVSLSSTVAKACTFLTN